MKKLSLAVAAAAVGGLLALASPAFAQSTVTSIAPLCTGTNDALATALEPSRQTSRGIE